MHGCASEVDAWSANLSNRRMSQWNFLLLSKFLWKFLISSKFLWKFLMLSNQEISSAKLSPNKGSSFAPGYFQHDRLGASDPLGTVKYAVKRDFERCVFATFLFKLRDFEQLWGVVFAPGAIETSCFEGRRIGEYWARFGSKLSSKNLGTNLHKQ